jgi:NitT/TauT family transport system substrate-binding protein
VQATKAFIDDKALAARYVQGTVFKGQISADDFNDAIANSPFSYDISAQHIQATTDLMVKTGVGRMRAPPVAQEWVRTELLAAAKKSLHID